MSVLLRPPLCSCTSNAFRVTRSHARFQTTFYNNVQPTRPSLVPWVTFAVGTSVASYGLAVWWTSNDTSKRFDQVTNHARLPSIFRAHNPSDETLAGARFEERVNRARKFVKMLPDTWRWPTIAAEWYASKTEGQIVCAGLVASFAVPFAIWQIPRARPFAKKYLWHDPLANRPVTLLTSVFSHRVCFSRVPISS